MHGFTSASGAIFGVLAMSWCLGPAVGGSVPAETQIIDLSVGRFIRHGDEWSRRDAGIQWSVGKDRLTVRLRDDTRRSIESILNDVCGGPRAWRELRRSRLGYVDIAVEGVDAIDVCRGLERDADVESAVPASIGRWMEGGDPYFAYQWHLKNTGQESQGMPGADLGVQRAWAFEAGDPSVTIAFLDSAVHLEHEDLRHAYVPNPGEVVGNGIDDDGNGFIDDLHGWNFGTDGPEVASNWIEGWHGTWVAGIAVARVGNGVSVAGVAGGSIGDLSGCRAIQVVIGVEGPDPSVIDDAILYAVDRGAEVICMTFAVPADPAMLAAIEEARRRGVLMVAPAGNQLPAVPFPANHPAVMAVGGTNRHDEHWGVATAGPSVEIAAPAYMIRTTDTAWPLWEVSGTSYAVPQVAATAALIMSWAECLDAETVRALMRSTAKDIDEPGWDPRTGWGRLDTGAAVARVASTLMPACRCREDLDGNGLVDGSDLGVLLAAWGGDDPLADLHLDGRVDAFDLGILVTAQGTCR